MDVARIEIASTLCRSCFWTQAPQFGCQTGVKCNAQSQKHFCIVATKNQRFPVRGERPIICETKTQSAIFVSFRTGKLTKGLQEANLARVELPSFPYSTPQKMYSEPILQRRIEEDLPLPKLPLRGFRERAIQPQTWKTTKPDGPAHLKPGIWAHGGLKLNIELPPTLFRSRAGPAPCALGSR